MLETAETQTARAPVRGGFLSRHWQKLAAAAIWVVLVGSFLGYTLVSGRTPTETLRALVDLLRTPLGPLIYIGIYTLRPLTFFSAVVTTMLAGVIWGPLWGLLFVVIGANLSATVAYLFGRTFGTGLLRPDAAGSVGGIVGRYAERLRSNAFPTVLVMHMIFLPYDLINYLTGFLRVPYRPFILGCALGSLPGTLTFVLAGASLDLDDIFAGRFSISVINPLMVALSALLLAGSLAVSRLLRRRERA